MLKPVRAWVAAVASVTLALASAGIANAAEPPIEADADLGFFLSAGPGAGETVSTYVNSPSGATQYSRTLGPRTVNTAAGRARGKTSVTFSIQNGPRTRKLSASGEISGSVHKTNDPDEGFVPTSNPESNLDAAFELEAPTPYTLSISLNAANSDGDWCTEALAELVDEGTLDPIVRRARRAGGGCSAAPPNVSDASGILAPGAYELHVELDGAIDPEDDGSSESLSGSWRVQLTLFPACTIEGTDGDDVRSGGSGRDVICGFGGTDDLFGNGGNDLIFGGPGNDALHGRAGEDELHGGPGFDVLFGGDGDDRMFGEGDNDVMEGEPGDDFMRGGPGEDTMEGDAGSDKLLGEDGADRLTGGTRKDVLSGGPNNDRIFAKDGVRDVVHGGGGNKDKAQVDGVDEVDGVEGSL
jgi:hypothetical protein